MYVGHTHTLCLPPRAAAVNQHLISIRLPDDIWVNNFYVRLNRDQLSCSLRGEN